MSLGSLDEAQVIGKTPYGDRAPKGWKTIGEGGYRKAYLSPSRIVYKVEHSYSDSETNLKEVRLANRLRKRKSLWRWDVAIPEFTPYTVRNRWDKKTVVNAVQYLPTERRVFCQAYYDGNCNCRHFGEARPCFALLYEYLEYELGLEDMWADNLSYNNRQIYVIDLGEG